VLPLKTMYVMLKIGNKKCSKRNGNIHQIKYIYTFSSFIDTECEYVQWLKLYLLHTDDDVLIGSSRKYKIHQTRYSRSIL